ncbi:MAG: hypothetical protein Ct9H300mP15_04570 [Gemmatimonadota bacterium]|nr:MAG: hypothetical protein Ct9H300mP15_04570 [Gemmatimonadota bacterium]
MLNFLVLQFSFRASRYTSLCFELTPDLETTDCGHRVDSNIVSLGQNVVLSESGEIQPPQGRPIQERWTLGQSATSITDHNEREYARVASYMMPIRDAIMCDLDETSLTLWQTLTAILRLNNIKTVQDLSGTPKEQVYSNDGIHQHLTNDGPDYNAMMKYLEESELELKCLAFINFDFTNPEGANHCEIHGLAQGSGLVIP